MRRLLIPLALAASLFAIAAAPAAADQSNHGWTLTLFNCSPGPTTYQVIAGPGIGIGGLSVVGSNMQYVIETQTWTDADGFHTYSVGKATANRELVTCHYIGPVSGRDYTNIGFFTPVGP